MQVHQRIDGAVIERRLVNTGLDQPRIEVVAQVFQHGQARGSIGRDHLGRREAPPVQIGGAGDEGLDPAGRQPRAGVVAQRPALVRRRLGRAGRGLGVGRLVHENQARAACPMQPLVEARGSVARQPLTPRVAETVDGEEGGLFRLAIRTQAAVLPRLRGG